MGKRELWLGVSVLGLASGPALAQSVAAAQAPAIALAAVPPGNTTSSAPAIIVTANRLDAARASVQASLGATSYGVDNATIQALPGGDNQPLNQVVLQLPGVVQDGFGQLHVRDDHNGLQYRIDGIILPEGLSVFGQTLSPRLIESLNLITGAMPAQYGLDTAGVIDITTKSGLDHNGGSISLYGGSHDTIEPSAEYGGRSGATTYFVSGSYRHDALGIDSVDGSANPIHDNTDQEHLFAYADHVIDAENRIAFIGGVSNEYFQIPNPRGLHPANGYDVDGQADFLSDDLNERQLERTGFGALSYLHNAGPFTWQTSLIARYSSLDYQPDVIGELLFNGQAQRAFKKDLSLGFQSDAAYRLSPAHTLRAGVLLTRDRGISDTTTYAFPVNSGGDVTGQPISIPDDEAATEWVESVYLQDEWKPLDRLTINFGGRFDHYCGYRCEQQLSPRVNAVWKPAEGTTLHAGYARYFSPPPFENVANTDLATVAPTTAAPAGMVDTTPYAERQNYFDVGLEQKMGPAITFTLDGYLRQSKNLVDEGQFGAPIILTPFNYRYGRIHGLEASLNYTHGPWLAYANFAYAKAQGKDIVSSQFSFDPADLAYIADHYIYLDHDQTYTASAGISYSFRGGVLSGSKLGGDMLYGSGLRSDGTVPNGDHLPGYAQFNLTASHRFDGPGLEVKLDLVNLFDHKYEIRDGSGIGVGAPEWGPRRGIFIGITKDI